ncbi:hypothetical protein DFP72DRAFT_1052692 [Ephemerocybe angulata]|uniref:Uncharacterized protein n=1 Tax=Ephemerocybe angulata TaxID=980116 RepID=A0A8H6HCF3_9AGAR|nr:hypothetical protein DFP72DRAFT_1052692 [Tulosesus angulatus]
MGLRLSMGAEAGVVVVFGIVGSWVRAVLGEKQRVCAFVPPILGALSSICSGNRVEMLVICHSGTHTLPISSNRHLVALPPPIAYLQSDVSVFEASGARLPKVQRGWLSGTRRCGAQGSTCAKPRALSFIRGAVLLVTQDFIRADAHPLCPSGRVPRLEGDHRYDWDISLRSDVRQWVAGCWVRPISLLPAGSLVLRWVPTVPRLVVTSLLRSTAHSLFMTRYLRHG